MVWSPKWNHSKNTCFLLNGLPFPDHNWVFSFSDSLRLGRKQGLSPECWSGTVLPPLPAESRRVESVFPSLIDWCDIDPETGIALLTPGPSFTFQGRLLNLSCSTVPTFVLSITATTQVRDGLPAAPAPRLVELGLSQFQCECALLCPYEVFLSLLTLFFSS